MDEEREAADELLRFAEVTVGTILAELGQKWSSHRKEDAEQDLVEIGWRVWLRTKNLGFARNRMTDRSKNLLRDYLSERRHEPTNESDLSRPSREPQPPHALIERSSREYDSALIAEVNDTLNVLPERQRAIAILRRERYTTQEMADLLGISLRTVDRELELIRKGVLNEQ
ncbi:MAG: sigma-70 family RNA polymerase sigma factor [Planctomycetaceae bacterium]